MRKKNSFFPSDLNKKQTRNFSHRPISKRRKYMLLYTEDGERRERRRLEEGASFATEPKRRRRKIGS